MQIAYFLKLARYFLKVHKEVEDNDGQCRLLLNVKSTSKALKAQEHTSLFDRFKISLTRTSWSQWGQLKMISVSPKPQFTSSLWWREASLCLKPPKKIQKAFKLTETSRWAKSCFAFFSENKNFNQDQKLTEEMTDGYVLTLQKYKGHAHKIFCTCFEGC